MSSNLNEKYFETKKNQKDSYPNNKRGYLVWIVIGLLAVSFFVIREILAERKLKAEKEKTTEEFIEQGVLSRKDTLFTSESTGTKILILENCLFKEFENNFAAVKYDSTGFVCIIKRIIPDADYSSSIEQWKSSIGNSASSDRFSNLKRDSLNDMIIETADVDLLDENKKEMKGKLKIIRKGGLYYFFELISYHDTWDKLSPDIQRIDESFEIVE